MLCPVCTIELHSRTYEGVPIDACEACQGCWLDGGELARIVSARQVKFDAEARRDVARRLRKPEVPPGEHERHIVCPKCREATETVNYGGDSGIIINRCPQCRGIWLDHGELSTIQMLVEGIEDELT